MFEPTYDRRGCKKPTKTMWNFGRIITVECGFTEVGFTPVFCEDCKKKKSVVGKSKHQGGIKMSEDIKKANIKDLVGEPEGDDPEEILNQVGEDIANRMENAANIINENKWQHLIDKCSDEYKPKKRGLPLGSRVWKFNVDYPQVSSRGQGIIGISSLLWDMPEEVFVEIFGVGKVNKEEK